MSTSQMIKYGPKVIKAHALDLGVLRGVKGSSTSEMLGCDHP